MTTVDYQAVAEDVEWLLDIGERPEHIARRFKVNLDALRTRLDRAGRPDLRKRLRKHEVPA